jgi:hypothetical protein
MIILLSGGEGQLAYDCKELLGTDHQVVVPEEKDLDITDPKKVAEKIRAVKPDIVLNCAAYTNVDGCISMYHTSGYTKTFSKGCVPLEFTAEAGHTYELYAVEYTHKKGGYEFVRREK